MPFTGYDLPVQWEVRKGVAISQTTSGDRSVAACRLIDGDALQECAPSHDLIVACALAVTTTEAMTVGASMDFILAMWARPMVE